MTRVYLFLDRLNFAETVLVLAIVGCVSFFLLGLLQLGGLYLAAEIRHWRTRREIRRMLAGDADRLVAHVSHMRRRIDRGSL